MKRDQIIETRQTLVGQLPVTGEILRGSLLERTVRHARGCATCAGGVGHPLSVLTVSYPGGRTRQFSLRHRPLATCDFDFKLDQVLESETRPGRRYKRSCHARGHVTLRARG